MTTRIRSWWRVVKAYDVVFLAAAAILAGCILGALGGCTTTPPSGVESAWLAVHAIDTAQTVTIARNPGCLYERNKLAAALYGSKHPSVGRVLATNTAMAALHWQVGAWLDRHTDRAFAEESDNRGALFVGRVAYYGLSFLGSGSAVVGNVRLGIKPAADSHQCAP